MKLDNKGDIKFPGAVLGLDVSADGATLYAACMDGGIYAAAPPKGEPKRLYGHDNFASGVHCLPDRPWLVSAGYDGCLIWFDLEAEKEVRRVKAHGFWSWRSALSTNGKLVASVTGQYLVGGYKYEPADAPEPTVKVYDATTGEERHAFAHQPPVTSVTISPDNRHLAAGNLMGGMAIWDLESGKRVWEHTTPSFTGWGIIKGHYYTGGIYSMMFTPDGRELLVCGMGSTRDPAAGNGKQLWQRFDWQANKKVAEAEDGEIGKGLMESLAWHPDHKLFVMAGRLFNGKWNTALFDADKGNLVHSLDTKMRTTHALFSGTGDRLHLAGTTDQGKKKEDKYPKPGRVKTYQLDLS